MTSLRWTTNRNIGLVVAGEIFPLSAPLGLSASQLGGLQRLRHALESYDDWLARSCTERDDGRLHR